MADESLDGLSLSYSLNSSVGERAIPMGGLADMKQEVGLAGALH